MADVAGSWPALTSRLDSGRTIDRWAAAEPALASIGAVAELPALLRPGRCRRRADEVVGALVRLAAADGGDDADAVLVLLHLLGDGLVAMAVRLRDLSPDILALLAGELTLQIRAFPWRRRTRAYTANLLLDTKHAVWDELGGGHGFRPIRYWEVPVDPLTLSATLEGSEDGDRVVDDVVDLLAWAAHRRVAPEPHLQLLLDLEQAAGYGTGAVERIAAQYGVNERTVRRRRDRTLAALRASALTYLQSVA